MVAPPSWFNATVADCDAERRFGVRLTAIIKHPPVVGADGTTRFERTVLTDFGPQTIIEQGDLLAVVGTAKQIRTLQRNP